MENAKWEIKNPETEGKVEFSVIYENGNLKIEKISSTPPKFVRQKREERFNLSFKGGVYIPTDDLEDGDNGFYGEISFTHPATICNARLSNRRSCNPAFLFQTKNLESRLYGKPLFTPEDRPGYSVGCLVRDHVDRGAVECRDPFRFKTNYRFLVSQKDVGIFLLPAFRALDLKALLHRAILLYTTDRL